MRAFILAGGAGTRLRPLTDKIPKPMVRLGGKPILEWNLRLLAQHGWREVIINLHHHQDVITDAFGDGKRFGLRITYSPEPVLRGTSGALTPWREQLSNTFILLYGDNLFDADLKALVQTHHDRHAVATIGTIWRQDVATSGLVEQDASHRVVRFVEKPANRSGSGLVNAGVLVLDPSIFDSIPAELPSDMSRDVLPALIEHGKVVTAEPLAGHVYWVDTLKDLEEAERRLSTNRLAPSQTQNHV